ncbi:hypothetical protein F5X97DRAFT_318234 [Nemania serpens]|nr:hypothetical protein F5X97DRAFT_318234 [Nemania serpens]
MERTNPDQSPKAASIGNALRGESRDALRRLSVTGPVRDAIAQKEGRRPVGRPRKSAEQSSDAAAQKGGRRPVGRPKKSAEQSSDADKPFGSPPASHGTITVAQGQALFHALNAHNRMAEESEKINVYVTEPVSQPASRPSSPPRGSDVQLPSFQELMGSISDPRNPPPRPS